MRSSAINSRMISASATERAAWQPQRLYLQLDQCAGRHRVCRRSAQPQRVSQSRHHRRASEALDFEAAWTAIIRPLNMPAGDNNAIVAGSEVFAQHCASCHGGAKWTKSQLFHNDNPAIPAPNVFNFFDPGVTNAGPQIVEYTKGDKTVRFMDNIGTFDPNDERELRGAGAAGQTALGAVGFNAPSLLSVDYHAPYFHNGAAQTLEEVLVLHGLGNGTIADALSAEQQVDLLAFLRSIDGRTPLFRSAADDFRDLF
ncbi:MAG: hypothetical protein R3F37_23495 [Candidatus Competibacteraceae bacterium]